MSKYISLILDASDFFSKSFRFQRMGSGKTEMGNRFAIKKLQCACVFVLKYVEGIGRKPEEPVSY